jgi:hypothetical protein
MPPGSVVAHTTGNRSNENFARELLELFPLGEGHYSEQDIKEVARTLHRLGGRVTHRAFPLQPQPRYVHRRVRLA